MKGKTKAKNTRVSNNKNSFFFSKKQNSLHETYTCHITVRKFYEDACWGRIVLLEEKLKYLVLQRKHLKLCVTGCYRS